MARYSLTVNYNDPNTGFELLTAIDAVLNAAEEAPTTDVTAPEHTPRPQERYVSQPRPAPQGQPQNATERPKVLNPDAQSTDKQIDLISTLIARKGIDDATFFDFIDAKFEKTFQDLASMTKGEASATIEALQAGEVAAAGAPF